MKLNVDCIRDLLLIIEEEQTMQKIDLSLLGGTGISNTGSVQPMYSSYFLSHEKLKSYSPDDIFYSIKQMGEDGLLNVEILRQSGTPQIYSIVDITPYGHEFIANLRSSSVWEKVKSALKTVSGASIPVIAKLATETMLKQLLLK